MARFICFHGYERSQFKGGNKLVWCGAELNSSNKRKRESYDFDFDHLLPFPIFDPIAPRTPEMSTVSLGSNIYCFLSGGNRFLCLDTTRPEIGWTELRSHSLNYRASPLTAVADGKIYVIGGAKRGPWGDVFNPCNGSWDVLDPPPVSSYDY